MIIRKYSAQVLFLIIAIIVCLSVSLSYATPEYAESSEQGCLTCHVDEEGGDLLIEGLEFAASGYVWPPKGGYRVLGSIRKPVRLFIGTLHILSAFMWFGTILYVHIILRPGYAARGLPKGEVVLGQISMIVVGITGILLTISRIRSIDVLYTSPWGTVLSVKIVLYIVMLTSAFFVIFFIGPKLKGGIKKPANLKAGIFDPVTLSAFNGKEGMPAYIAYKEQVYDVSGLKLWKNGAHIKHSSGQDLTDFIAKAPHGEEKLEGLKVIGPYNAGLKPPKTSAQKAFYFIAYMNLAIVFCVLFVIAYWRWGL
jgi:predicted heme/steroid binding protein